MARVEDACGPSGDVAALRRRRRGHPVAGDVRDQVDLGVGVEVDLAPGAEADYREVGDRLTLALEVEVRDGGLWLARRPCGHESRPRGVGGGEVHGHGYRA